MKWWGRWIAAETKMSGEGFAGMLAVHTNRVQSTMILNGHQWEIAHKVLDLKSKHLSKGYVLFDVAKGTGTNTFTCAVEDQHNRMDRMHRSLTESAIPNAWRSLWTSTTTR